MAVNFRGYLFQDDGDAVNGATVQLLETGTTTVEASTTTDSDGLWYFSESDQDRYDVKIASGTSVRYIRWDDQISLKEIDVRNNTGNTTPAATFTNLTNNAANQVAVFSGANSTKADNDEIYLSFKLADSAGNIDEFARMTVVATDVTATTEDGQIEFDVMKAGNLTKVWTITSSAAGAMSFDMNVDALTIGSGADTDVSLTFDANSADGVITWMEDEDYFKFSDDILVNSTERINFYDTAIYIYSSTDGQLDLVADTEIQIAATTIDINGAVAFDGALTGITNITLSGTLSDGNYTFDTSGNVSGLGTVGSGAITSTGLITGVGITSTGDFTTTGAAVDWDLIDNTASALSFDASGKTGILKIDTRNGAERVTMSGDLSVAGVTVSDSLIALANDNTGNSVDVGFYGRYRTNGTDLYTGLAWDATISKYILFHGNQAEPTTHVDKGGTGYTASTLVLGEINVTGEVQTTGIGYTDGDNAMTIADGGGVTFPVSIDITGSTGIILENDETITNSTNGLISFSGNLAIPDGGTIGSASDTDSITISSGGVVTMDQIPVFSAGINVSGGTIAGTLATAAQGNVTSLGTLTALTVDDVAINGKVVTMTGSSSDTAVFTAGTNGTLSIVTTDAAAAAANIQITADGTAELAGTTVTLDSAADIELEAGSGGDINIPADVGLTFGDDGEKIEGDGTDLTITGNKINLESSDEVLFSGKLICTPVAYTNTSTNFSIFHGNWDTNAITTNTGTNMVMGMRLDVPNIVVGTVQPNLASTLYVNGAPTEAVKNYALHVDAGDCRFDGDVDPGANNSSSLGSSSLKWATIYAVTTNIGDLTLDNTWSDGNDVDGTTGNWTVQEGQSGLFLINNITGKHYKFNVSEVS